MDQAEFKGDIVGELAEACQGTGIRLGCYYSIADWHHPEYEPYFSNRNGFHYAPNPDAEITKYMFGQIEELCVSRNREIFCPRRPVFVRGPNFVNTKEKKR